MPRGGVRPGGGRPKGSPNKPTPFKELARTHAPAAFQRIVDLVGCADPNVALRAAQTIIDRAYGRAPQAISGPEGEGAAEMVVRWLK